MRLKNNDLTEGNISKNIFSFSIPLVIGLLIQVLFNMTDQIVLGQMAGDVALASVGACSTVVGLIVNFFSGLGGGATIVLARSIGMKNHARSKMIISTTMITALGIGVLASLIALPCGAPLLRITECPDACFDGAYTYTMIYYLSIPAITIYNYGAGILRVSGDSKRPTIYLIIAGAMNLVMNIILCLVMTNKVAAVAIATLVSQVVGAFLTTRRLLKMDEEYKLNFKELSFKWEIFGKIMRYGIPTGLNSSLYCIANLQIQAAINSYGVEAVAGHSAASSIDSLVAAFTGSISTTISTMVGQNLGAEKRNRVKRSIFLGILYNVVISATLCIIVYMFRVPLLKLYVSSDEAIDYAVIRMQQVLLWYGLNAYNSVMGSVLNAFGYSTFSMLSNLTTTVVFRTIWMQFVYPRFQSFRMIMVCFTVAWCMTTVLYTLAFSIVYTRFKHGKIRKI